MKELLWLEDQLTKLSLYEKAVAETVLKVAEYTVLPLAHLGAYLRTQGEEKNEGFPLARKIAKRRWKIQQLEERLSYVDLGQRIQTRLLTHLKRKESPETLVANQLISPSADQDLLQKARDLSIVKGWFLPMKEVIEKRQASMNKEPYEKNEFFYSAEKDAFYEKQDPIDLDLSEQRQVILSYAKQLAPRDFAWHKQIEHYFEAVSTPISLEEGTNRVLLLNRE